MALKCPELAPRLISSVIHTSTINLVCFCYQKQKQNKIIKIIWRKWKSVRSISNFFGWFPCSLVGLLENQSGRRLLPYIDLGGASKRLLRLLGLLYFTLLYFAGKYNMTTNFVGDVTFELGIILPTHINIITGLLPKKRWSAELVDRFICASVFLDKPHLNKSWPTSNG